jgi:hypothetical protein
MKEEFLHYIWSQELYKKHYQASTGEQIDILSPGVKNTDSGPDFENARIKIDNTIWAGNVEIHTDSSNWTKHKHHLDPAYDNVILHAVGQLTKEACRTNGEIIPTIEIYYDEKIYQTFLQLVGNKNRVPCEEDIYTPDKIILSFWLSTLCIERLETKSELIRSIYHQSGNNWEETFYIVLAKSFGFNTNSLPFEMLAKSLPLKLLLKHRENIQILEALLQGQAGFLDSGPDEDDYFNQLKKEYTYFKKAYKLTPIQKHLWKFLRLRPVNFPTVRIAQFANLIFNTDHLFSRTLDSSGIDELTTIFTCKATPYWDNHYTFEKETVKKEKKLGTSALQTILINTVIPFLFIYGKQRNKKELEDKAMQFLEELPAEKNRITKNWERIGVIPESAMQSQALIQLTKNYCNVKNCLFCQLGNAIIREKIK